MLLFVAKPAAGQFERRPGQLLEEATVNEPGHAFRLQRYAVAGYGIERQVAFWCKTDRTQDKPSRKVAAQRRMSIDSDGWEFLISPYVGPPLGAKDIPAYSGLPRDRAHAVTPDIAYVDMGPARVAVTFDRCASHVTLGAPLFYQKLFTKGELKGEFKTIQPPVFVGQAVGKDGSICFYRVNPVQSTRPETFDVCTLNRGVVWFVRRGAASLSPPSDEDAAHAYSDSNRPAEPLPRPASKS